MRGADKLFSVVAGRPLLAHSISAFESCEPIDRIVLVVSEANLERGRSLVAEEGFAKVVAVCTGGPRRQDSVKRGLAALGPCDWVAVHDGGRPLVRPGLITRGLEAARETGAAVPVLPLADTIKEIDETGAITRTLNRSRLVAVQTPQGIRYTRNGEFTLNSDRQIVTAQGFPLLGGNGRPIVLPDGQIQVGMSGDVSVDGVLAGQIEVTHFKDLNQLRKSGSVLFEALPGAQKAPPERLSVKQGFLEKSNVNPVAGMADAINNMRSFEMLARAIRSISNDVNRKVIDEVGRV